MKKVRTISKQHHVEEYNYNESSNSKQFVDNKYKKKRLASVLYPIVAMKNLAYKLRLTTFQALPNYLGNDAASCRFNTVGNFNITSAYQKCTRLHIY